MSKSILFRPASLAQGLLVVALTLVFSTGCEKPEAELGLELLPGSPLDLTVETAGLHAFTFRDSAVQTSGLTRNLVGSYLDPDFGSLKASMVGQLRLTANNIGQGIDVSGLVADSIVLALAFEQTVSHYGGLGPQRFVVQELGSALSIDSVYRSDRMPDVLNEDLVSPHAGEITPKPTSFVVVGSDTLGPQLRIRLKMALAERLLSAFGTSSLVDNAAFASFFKGLRISVDNAVQAPYQGGILYFNTIGGGSKLTLYYHNELDQPELQRTFDMVFSASGVRYTQVERDVTQAVNSGLAEALMDTETAQSAVYLQTLGGYRVGLRFPGLQDLSREGRILTKAELVAPVNGTYYPFYSPPGTLLLFRRTGGSDQFLPDQLNGIGGVGGAFDAVGQQYRFNITRYVQQVMSGVLPNDGLVLVAGSSGVTANRVVLCGSAHPDTPMRLLLTFTTY